LTEQEANLPGADANIPGRHIDILPNVPKELGHEGLAEAHDLVVTTTFGVEIRSTLAASHGKCRE